MNLDSLPTNLKTIAKTLELEFGEAKMLHYGLFGQSNAQDISLLVAQSKFREKLMNYYRDSVDEKSRCLVIGNSFQYFAEQLQNAGINAEGSIGFEGHTSNSFDCIILEGSFPYLHQLSLLSSSRALLKKDGKLLLFGEFLDDDTLIEHSELPNLSSFKQLSERLGFKLLIEDDCTHDARQSLSAFLPLTETHRDELIGLLGSEKSLQREQSALTLAAGEFASGRRCFRVFLLSSGSALDADFASAEYSDIESFDPFDLSQLFEKSFGTNFDSDLWNWKYDQGRGRCVVARPEPGQDIAAHYGGAPRVIDYFGERSMAIQICDVMVLPEIRRQYGRNSLFFKAAATFLEREIGNTVKHLLGFGFPNQKAMNIAIRLGLYDKTDDFVEVVYQPPQDDEYHSTVAIENVEIDNAQQHQELDRLWQQMRIEHRDGIVGVRDWEYIRYRYFDHPYGKAQNYKVQMLRNTESQQVLAVVVLKEHENSNLLMDIICPRQLIPEVIKELVQRIYEQDELAGLKLWITKSKLESVLVDGAIVNELGIEIPCNSWNPGPSAETLYGAWWLTAGDMDFM